MAHITVFWEIGGTVRVDDDVLVIGTIFAKEHEALSDDLALNPILVGWLVVCQAVSCDKKDGKICRYVRKDVHNLLCLFLA